MRRRSRPYADELADFVPQGTVYLWEYPGSGELYGKLSPEDLTQADFLPYDAVYVDEQGQTWVYIPYLYGREGWICCADPENASPARDRAAGRCRRAGVPGRGGRRRAPDRGGRTRLYLAIGAVAVVALGSAVLLVVLARRKQ